MVELIFGLAGLLVLVTAKVPYWIVGKKDYGIFGNKARLIGLIMLLPLPMALAGGVIFNALFGERGADYAFPFELAVFTIDLIVAAVLIRRFRAPTTGS